MLQDVEYKDRIEASAADGGGPIAVEVRLNMAEMLMISGASALCVCVVHRNILIDYSSMDASVPHVRGHLRCRHRHQSRAIPILPAEAVGG